MPWFRLEGRGAFHHKVLAAGNEAYGAWCRAGQWCSDQLTDGRVPRAVADQIAKPKVWAKLIEAGLMHEADGGYQIHDYLDWNPSSEQERAKRDAMREKRREAGRAGGIRSGEVRRGEAEGKQTGSTIEANAKQSASGLLEANTKQNEAPSPSPIPIEREDILSPGPPGAAQQLALVPTDPPKARRRQAEAPSQVTEVRGIWQTAWSEANMPGPAPWGADAAACAKRYLDAPGASIESAKQAIVGMLRTPSGTWHRTEEGGRHATIPAALAGKLTVGFTTAGRTWLAEQDAAKRPKRVPPPPREIPEVYKRMHEQDMARRQDDADPAETFPEAS
ncbi:MAG: hypothetical protein FJX78_10365 [Armatimonadetes bacterium]|nr:hypothetical protein [Armatimonadota bacterium]